MLLETSKKGAIVSLEDIPRNENVEWVDWLRSYPGSGFVFTASEEYCDSWNNKRKKELIKQAEKDAQIIAAIPRKPAKNYNINYVGETYESLEILECVNDSLESVPIPYYNQRHQKWKHLYSPGPLPQIPRCLKSLPL